MADVKWIKIYTDMVNNKKIKSIRKMPDGNSIVLIWVLLIAQAGESNKTGALYLTDTIPYSVDELAVQLDFNKKVLEFALIVLEKYQMIEIFDEIIYIKNWEKYQNETGLEKIREQGRVRVARFREKNKVLEINSKCNVTVTLPVTHGNAIEGELRIKNKEKDINIHKFGSQKNVKLTDDELQKLTIDFPNEIDDAIEILSMWLADKGDKSKSKTHNITIRRWVIDATKEKHARGISLTSVSEKSKVINGEIHL